MVCKDCRNDAETQKTGFVLPKGEGHEACKGCDCQHLPVKEGQIKNG